MSHLEEIIVALTSSKSNNSIKFPQLTCEKDRDVDNYAIISRALRNRNSNINDFYEVFLNHYIDK